MFSSLKKSISNDVIIDFSPLQLDVWREKCGRVSRFNLLQSYDYARAIARISSLRPRFGVIRSEGCEVGLVQVMTTGLLGGRIEAVTLDRGPVWFNENVSPDLILGFFSEFARLYPRRWLRRRRIIPELPINLIQPDQLQALGYHLISGASYQTVWLDLRGTVDDLRARFDKKWRYDLAKGEAHQLSTPVFSSAIGPALKIAALSALDQKKRGYHGLSIHEGKNLLTAFAAGDGFVSAIIEENAYPIATALFIRHGRTATYQIGHVEKEGRQKNANYVLLWQSILFLKNNGVTELDLGGVNDQDAKGIAHFKQGMGGHHVHFIGQFS